VAGPLTGYRVVEFAGMGPAPFAAMMLADMGADVIRIDRAAAVEDDFANPVDPLSRGRRSLALDLKQPRAVEIALDLVATADVLIEGFRPGVMERLGLGPEPCRQRRPALVYGRMTGWGQDGPYAQNVGHDINYLSVAGALAHIGRSGEPPTPPLNLVGDFGGGGMLLTVGILAALLEAKTSGRGQVVDAAMVDGAALLLGSVIGLYLNDHWTMERGDNLLDSGAPFYDTYETSDGLFVAVGALERRFYQVLLDGCGVADRWEDRFDKRNWPELRAELAAAFRTKTRAEWVDVFRDTDGCVTPVLRMDEVTSDPHIAARGTYTLVDGALTLAPAPRFSRSTTSAATGPNTTAGQHTMEILMELGHHGESYERLRADGVVQDNRRASGGR
jgi:alpha-methylacyl-CoA racemase